MNITEIMNNIHKNNAEAEVFEILSEWMIRDRKEWMHEAITKKATINVINKIANGNSNKNAAIEGIKNLCSEDE